MLRIEVDKSNVDAKIEGEGEERIIRAEILMAFVALVDTYSVNYDIPFENAALTITQEAIAAYRHVQHEEI